MITALVYLVVVFTLLRTVVFSQPKDNVNLGVILEDTQQEPLATWPKYHNETLAAALDAIDNRLGLPININLVYTFVNCSTKKGLIESTFLLVDKGNSSVKDRYIAAFFIFS